MAQGFTNPSGGSGGGGTTLPVADTTLIVKGSADPTKQIRFEVDGLTAGVTRVITVPDANVTLWNNPMTDSGDIITGGASGVAGRLAIGATAGHVLKVVSGAPAWGTPLTADVKVGTMKATAAPIADLHTASESSSDALRGLMVSQHSNSAHGAQVFFRKSRGTFTTPTVIANGDNLGYFFPEAFDGTSYQLPGSIAFKSNGAVTTGSVPTDMIFSTGASGGGTERMRIKSDGMVGIGNTNPTNPFMVNASNALAMIYATQAGSGDLLVLASGAGERFRLANNGSIASNTGASLTTAGIWTNNSSREVKENFSPANPELCLERILALPVYEYNYKVRPNVRHCTPVAESFHAMFGYGENNVSLSPADIAGVALAAIKALAKRIREIEHGIAKAE